VELLTAREKKTEIVKIKKILSLICLLKMVQFV